MNFLYLDKIKFKYKIYIINFLYNYLLYFRINLNLINLIKSILRNKQILYIKY